MFDLFQLIKCPFTCTAMNIFVLAILKFIFNKKNKKIIIITEKKQIIKQNSFTFKLNFLINKIHTR